MVKNQKNRNLIKVDFPNPHNFVVGQKVYKVEKDCLLFGTLETIAQTQQQNNFVRWEGKNCLIPEHLNLLHCAEQFDSKEELIICRSLNEEEWTETVDLATKTKISILDCETILDRLKTKKLVLRISGCWKRSPNLNGEIPIKESLIVKDAMPPNVGGILVVRDAEIRVEELPNQVFQRVAQLKSAARFALKDPQEIKIFCLDEILIDNSLQSRAGLNLPHVEILRSQLQGGKEFDPVELMQLEDGTLLLYHGFHRFEAHRKENTEVIRAIALEGSRNDALLLSLSSNCDNKPQLARSSADKRHSVSIVLNHPDWKDWSDRAIAQICQVDHKTVGKIRKNLNGDFPIENEKRKFTNKYGGVSIRKIAPITEAVDLPTRSLAEIALNDEKNNQQILSDILIAVSSNIDRFSIEQLEFLARLIGDRLTKRIN